MNKYANEKWCVRCHRKGPTPYLKQNIETLLSDLSIVDTAHGMLRLLPIVDIGCGNGRNTKFMKALGFSEVLPFDMVGDYGYQADIGRKGLPLFCNTVQIFLANYVLMFLSEAERSLLLEEIKRTSRQDAVIMVELYPAKDSYTPDEAAMLGLQREIFNGLGWPAKRYSKGRFIAARCDTLQGYVGKNGRPAVRRAGKEKGQ